MTVENDGQQLALFQPERLDRRTLQEALARLDVGTSVRLAEAYRQLWGKGWLTWEPAVLDFYRKNHLRKLDLDGGYRLWKRFSAQRFFERIPEYFREEIRHNFFRRLLSAHRSLFPELRTRGGRSIGYLTLLAGWPVLARRNLEKELRYFGEDAGLRLNLANAYLACGDPLGAAVNYREALLQKLPPERYSEVAEPRLRDFLAELEEPNWAAVEACVRGLLPVPRFQSNREWEEYVKITPCLREESLAGTRTDPVCEFYGCLVASENARWTGYDFLVRCRRRMRALHPRFFALYMGRKESP